ncbi:MAG TPA: hypothetical protein VIY72_00960 [Acidimicrobiales bacterium]
MTAPEPLMIDLSDFDAVGVLSDVVVTLRAHVMATDNDAAATIDAPAGWHHVVVTAKPGGSTVLVVRYGELSLSRLRNVADALHGRGWQLDEDGEGATLRQPPGTAATDAAFEALAVLGTAGAPTTPRAVTAVDSRGTTLDLHQ